MQSIYYLLILTILSFGCSHSGNNSVLNNSNENARGFKIENYGNVTKLTVFNPWEKAKNISMEYFLLGKNKPLPDSLSGKTIIRTPVERVICLSTTHLAFLNLLDENDAITGISGSQYVSNPEIRKRMESDGVPDVGYGQNLNYELIVNQKPELVMVYGIGGEVTSYTQKIEELGIPVIMVAEYLEETPLGKAEWIKFIGALFNKNNVAEELFNHIESEYNRLKDIALQDAQRPKVLVGSPYKDSWWVPGGKSYLANLISDAGGEYLGKENSSHESYVISFEHALTWAGEADIWINMGNYTGKSEILSADERFGHFPVFKNGRLYNNVKRLGNHGGNDFWESGTVNPHLILQDLISVFHPGLIEKDLVYYQEIK
jgi:iron complex transport system substrate-binding protein